MDVWYCQGFPVVPRDIYVVWRVLRLQGRGWPCLRCVGNASIFGEGDLSKMSHMWKSLKSSNTLI